MIPHGLMTTSPGCHLFCQVSACHIEDNAGDSMDVCLWPHDSRNAQVIAALHYGVVRPGLDPAFVGATYLERMAIMCQRLQASGLYDMAWAVGVLRNPADSVEPLEAVGWAAFSDGLAKTFARHQHAPED